MNEKANAVAVVAGFELVESKQAPREHMTDIARSSAVARHVRLLLKAWYASVGVHPEHWKHVE